MGTQAATVHHSVCAVGHEYYGMAQWGSKLDSIYSANREHPTSSGAHDLECDQSSRRM